MAKTFKPRMSAPLATDKQWIHYSAGGYSSCIKVNGNSCLPNCVGYAQGRVLELLGATKVNWKLPACNAEDWIETAQKNGLKTGQTPKLGAVICWSKGKLKDGSDGCGHVAVVEEIKSNGDIVISQSGYRKYTGAYWANFYTSTITKASGYSNGAAYKFRGFIYPDYEFETEVKTQQEQPVTNQQPTKIPIGTLVKLKPGVKWSNGSTPASWVFNRTLTVVSYSGNYIRLSTQGINGAITGSILPDKVEIISSNTPQQTQEKVFAVGDIVQFTGNAHYTSSYAGGIKKTAKPCTAKVTAISKEQKHPYHLIGTSVYGWVDTEFIKK